jgi:hypothetical protein
MDFIPIKRDAKKMLNATAMGWALYLIEEVEFDQAIILEEVGVDASLL